MYVYKVNDDGVTCAVQYHRIENGPIPAGYTEVPPALENKTLFMDGGTLTDQKPQILIDKDVAWFDAEKKIQKKMRELAVAELKKTGELPPDFEDGQ
jgi:hypothetical protein